MNLGIYLRFHDPTLQKTKMLIFLFSKVQPLKVWFIESSERFWKRFFTAGLALFSSCLLQVITPATGRCSKEYKSSPAVKQLSNFYLALRLLQLEEAAEDLIQKEIDAEKAGVEHDCILPDDLIMPEEELDSIFNSLLKIWIK